MKLMTLRRRETQAPWWEVEDGGGFPPWWSWSLGPPPLQSEKPWPSDWDRRPHP